MSRAAFLSVAMVAGALLADGEGEVPKTAPASSGDPKAARRERQQGRVVRAGTPIDAFLCDAQFWGELGLWVDSRGVFEILEASAIGNPKTAPYADALYTVRARVIRVSAAGAGDSPAPESEVQLVLPAFRNREPVGTPAKAGDRLDIPFFSERRAGPRIQSVQLFNDLDTFDLPVYFGCPAGPPHATNAVSDRQPCPPPGQLPVRTLTDLRRETLARLREARAAEFGTLDWTATTGSLARLRKELDRIPFPDTTSAETDPAGWERLLQRRNGHYFWPRYLDPVCLPALPAAADDPAHSFADHMQAVSEQFARHGITFIYIPIPNKLRYMVRHLGEEGARLDPKSLSIAWRRGVEELLERGVQVVSIEPDMLRWAAEHPEAELYLHDHHVSFLHADFLCRKAAEHVLLACPDLARDKAYVASLRRNRFAYRDDHLAAHPVDRLVVAEAGSGAPFEADPASPVIVFGDSNVNKDFPDYLSFYLQHAVARGGRWLFDQQGGASAIPAGVFAGRKVVVYVSMLERTGLQNVTFLKKELVPERAFAAGAP